MGVEVLVNGRKISTKEVTVAGPDSAPETSGPRTSKAMSATSPGWVPAPVKNWNSRDGAAMSSTKETTPIGEASAGELATKLAGRLLSGESMPTEIKKLLAKLLKRV